MLLLCSLQPVGIFSFISGRRGPYGVQEYEFKMLEKDLFELNGTINRLTGESHEFVGTITLFVVGPDCCSTVIYGHMVTDYTCNAYG